MKAPSRSQVVGGLLTATAIAAAAIAMITLGSPGEERARRLDERRTDDLAALSRLVDLYWTRYGKLPASLDDLRREGGSDLAVLADPVTKDAYEYRTVDTDTYELCARFERESSHDPRASVDVFWSHSAGRRCFQRKARSLR
jgi:hypothetical protein